MTDKLQQIIKEEVAKRPKEIQGAINAIGWPKITENIGASFSLNESEINDLQVETLLVLVGLQSIDFYPVNIENNVGTTTEEAKKIADEVLKKIFNPIAAKVEENVKKNMGNKVTNLEQTVDFILSGGDYSVFIAPTQVEREEKTDKLLGSSNIVETKGKLLE